MIRIIILLLFLLTPLTAHALIERKLSYASDSACDPITGADIDLSFGCTDSYSGSGTAVNDLAGTVDFTISETMTFTTDHLEMNGSGYLYANSIPAAAEHIHESGASDYVLAIVFRTESTPSNINYFWSFYESGTEYLRSYYFGNSSKKMRFLHRAFGGTATTETTSTYTSGSTDHCVLIAVDVSASDVKYYVNSLTEETDTASTFAYSGTQTGITDIQIGANGAGTPPMPSGARLYEAQVFLAEDYAGVDDTFASNVFAAWEARHTGLDCTP